jgi:membrane-associated phospholipid phosphatase
MRKALIAAALVAATGSAQAKSGVATFSDVAGYGMPVLALGMTLIDGDTEGMKQLGLAGVTTVALTQGLKYAINADRPNGGERGFPSGHTSTAFFAAGFIHQRYGWHYGIPAHLLAAGVGWARGDQDYHNWGQVIAGAALGEAAALLFTTRRDESVQWLPFAGRDGKAIGVQMHKSF